MGGWGVRRVEEKCLCLGEYEHMRKLGYTSLSRRQNSTCKTTNNKGYPHSVAFYLKLGQKMRPAYSTAPNFLICLYSPNIRTFLQLSRPFDQPVIFIYLYLSAKTW